MVDRSRFEEVIHEANDLDSPSAVRYRELCKVIGEQWKDQLLELYKLQTETMLMSKELWDTLVQDPEFSGNEDK